MEVELKIYNEVNNDRNGKLDLLNALKNEKEEDFKNDLSSKDININFVYHSEKFMRLIDLACSQSSKSKFIKFLLDTKNVDVNSENIFHGKSPLHFAVEYGNMEAVNILLNYPEININNAINGNTPLHGIIKKMGKLKNDKAQNKEDFEMKNYEEIVKLLINRPEIEVNIPDHKNVLPIYSAVTNRLENVIKIIIDSKKPIDFDLYVDEDKKTAKSLLKEYFPSIDCTTVSHRVQWHTLIFHMNDKNEEKFLEDFHKLNEKDEIEAITKVYSGMTLLQHACEKGMTEAVKMLIEKGSDINGLQAEIFKRPIVLACTNGYPDVLRVLLGKNGISKNINNNETLLQLTIRYAKFKYKECIKILLEEPDERSKINNLDTKKNTALHYAVRDGDPDVILALLRNGACISIPNEYGDLVLTDMPCEILEKFLDECVQTNNKRSVDEDYEIYLKYGFLTSLFTQSDNDIGELYKDRSKSETNALLYMSKCFDYKQLLKHPIITSFLYLKWKKIRTFFFINVLIYSLFLISLLIYILYSFEEETSWIINGLIRPFVILGLFALILREFLQMLVAPLAYLKNVENYFETVLIVTVSILMFSSKDIGQNFYAVIILLSATVLILLIGKLPSFSTIVVMLKRVSWNFFKFFLWYSILIIAFALSFYTLFRSVKVKNNTPGTINIINNKTSNNQVMEYFFDPVMSTFRTIVMLTGEFDSNSIDFSLHPVMGRLIFIVFVFMVPIVLFNLLNGLAVSDAQAIKSEAELIGYISQIEMITYFENTILSNFLLCKYYVRKLNKDSWFRKFCDRQYLRVSKCIKNCIFLFPDYLPRAMIGIKINQGSKIVIKYDSSQGEDQTVNDENLSCFYIYKCNEMDSRIVKAAKYIIAERIRIENSNTGIQKQLEEIKDLLRKVLDEKI